MNNPDFKLRTFRFQEDYAAVYALWQSAGSGIQLRRSDEPAEIQKKLQRDPDLFLVAETDGCIVGAVLGGFDGRRGLVYHLAVAAEYRRFGLGRYLMEELEQRLRARGCLRIYLLVTGDNQPAMRFYEQSGWERMELLIYGKDLT